MNRGARGFTLLEVLLAITLLAAGLALAFASLRSATTMVGRGEAMAQRSERLRAVESALRRSLGDARAIAFARSAEGKPQRFIGEAQHLRFVADLPDYFGVGGPHVYDLQAVDEEGGQRLQLDFARLQSPRTPQTPIAPERLADTLQSVQFAYRGLDEADRLGDWQTTWPSPERLPQLVKIDVSDRQGPWPELIVALPQDTPTAAALPAVQGGRP